VTDPNLFYSLIQIVHNFGAALVLGAPLFLLGYRPESVRPRRVMVLLAFAWGVQALSGTSFGLTSLAFYGELPDLSRVALAALSVKVSCAIIALVVTVGFLWLGREAVSRGMWYGLTGLAAVALSAAAVLRWFS
jgi:hypothetical protein